MQTVLITGANRGVGLSCSRRYAEAGLIADDGSVLHY